MVIDNKYCGANDCWKFPALAMQKTTIHKGDRICQFRIVKCQPEISFEVSTLEDNNNRGGFGSSGIK